MKKIAILVSMIMVISGCSLFKRADRIVLEEKQPLNIREQEPLEMRDVEWIVVTEKNFEQVMKDLKERGIDPVLFSLTDNYYENLSLNFSEMIIYIKIEKDINGKYKLYYEPPKNKD